MSTTATTHRQTSARFPPAKKASTYPIWLMFVAIVCQLALLSGRLQSARALFRAAPFLLSLALLFLVRGRRPRHPATWLAQLVLVLISLQMLLHPETDIFLSGLAHTTLYFAILAPLFWAPKLKADINSLTKLFMVIWGFQTLSALFGVLQTYFPGSFQPSLSVVLADRGENYVESMQIGLASGEEVFRPMGLTDTPGGAASAGFYAVLLGAGILLLDKRPLMRVCCVVSMCIGMLCLYLCQVRSLVVFLGVCTIVLMAILAWRKETKRLTILGAVLGGVVLVAFVWAISLGGDQIMNRLGGLVEDHPSDVYYNSRGVFLQITFEYWLPQFPLGAGVGRWGNMNRYFGDPANGPPLWAEIQWTGWLFDGGIPMMILYPALVLFAIFNAWKIAKANVPTQLWLIAAIVVAYDLGALALTFNSPYFQSQGAIEFWLFNGLLFSVAMQTPLPPRRRLPA